MKKSFDFNSLKYQNHNQIVIFINEIRWDFITFYHSDLRLERLEDGIPLSYNNSIQLNLN